MHEICDRCGRVVLRVTRHERLTTLARLCREFCDPVTQGAR